MSFNFFFLYFFFGHSKYVFLMNWSQLQNTYTGFFPIGALWAQSQRLIEFFTDLDMESFVFCKIKNGYTVSVIKVVRFSIWNHSWKSAEELYHFQKALLCLLKQVSLWIQQICLPPTRLYCKMSWPFVIFYRTIMTVWKTVLDETKRVGQQRLIAADTYLQEISESSKPLINAHKHTVKKVSVFFFFFQ